MTPDFNLQFIREKIYELRSAIMYSMSDDLIKLPNNIISAIRVDNEGQLWFLSKKPIQFLSECEQNFPARLKFFRKGLNYFLEVSGKATIIGHDCDLEGAESNEEKTANGPVLVKMTMNHIVYTEPTQKTKTKMELFLEKSYQWLLRNIAIPHQSKSSLTKLRQHI